MTIHTPPVHLAGWHDILQTRYAESVAESEDLVALETHFQALLKSRLDDISSTCLYVSLLDKAVAGRVTSTFNYRHAWDGLLYSFAITKDVVVSEHVM